MHQNCNGLYSASVVNYPFSCYVLLIFYTKFGMTEFNQPFVADLTSIHNQNEGASGTVI